MKVTIIEAVSDCSAVGTRKLKLPLESSKRGVSEAMCSRCSGDLKFIDDPQDCMPTSGLDNAALLGSRDNGAC